MEEIITSPLFSFDYSVDSRLSFEAVLYKNNSFGKTRKIIQTVLFLALAALTLYNYIAAKAGIMFFFSLICIVLAICVWYLPYSNAKMLSKAYSEAQNFTLAAYEDKIVITGSETTAELVFEDAMKAEETEKLILLEQPDALFPISKENIGEENGKKLCEFLGQKLCERFKGFTQR